MWYSFSLMHQHGVQLWWILQEMAFMATKLMENLALQHPLVMLKTCFCLNTSRQSLCYNVSHKILISSTTNKTFITQGKYLWAEYIYNWLLVIQPSLGTRRGSLVINYTETMQRLSTNSSNTIIASTNMRLWIQESGSCRAEQNQLEAPLRKFQFIKIKYI